MIQENDVVLIYCEDQPLTYAKIEEIFPDIKVDWYHVKMLVLQIPLQVVTWTLRNAYIEGDEFTISGKKFRIEAVVCPEKPPASTTSDGKNNTHKDLKTGKVILFSDHSKN